MENPFSWPDEVKVIETAMAIYHMQHQLEPDLIGGSIFMAIYNALKEAGHLKEKDEGNNNASTM